MACMDNSSGRQWDSGISLVRFLAMCCIVICHLGSYVDNALIAQFFNVGVPVFFIMSGFLYGRKTISAWDKWFARRWVTLMVPCYLCLAFVAAFHMYGMGQPLEKEYVVTMLLNLQGLSFLFPSGKMLATYGELGHLWFMTVLMGCYACLPLLQKMRGGILRLSRKTKQFLLAGGILLAVALACVWDIHLSYFVMFAFGYFWGNSYKDSCSKGLLLWGAGAAVAVLLRLAGRYAADDTPLYDSGIVFVTHFYLAVFLFRLVTGIWSGIEGNRCYPRLRQFVYRYLPAGDALTFYIYIVHCLFLSGPLGVRHYCGDHQALGILLALVLSLLSALLLRWISQPVIRAALRWVR